MKEMLKVATMMQKAMRASNVEEDDSGSMMDFNLSSRLHNLKEAKILASEITEAGAKLYDSLG